MTSKRKTVVKTTFGEVMPILRKKWGWTSKKAPASALDYDWIYHCGSFEVKGETAMTNWIRKNDIPNNVALLQMIFNANVERKRGLAQLQGMNVQFDFFF